jgi:hypothetical protein
MDPGEATFVETPTRHADHLRYAVNDMALHSMMRRRKLV